MPVPWTTSYVTQHASTWPHSTRPTEHLPSQPLRPMASNYIQSVQVQLLTNIKVKELSRELLHGRENKSSSLGNGSVERVTGSQPTCYIDNGP